jgi:hypothetical protein
MRARPRFVPAVAGLERRDLQAIVTAVEVVEVPGPTDVVETTGTNPAGKLPPGQQDVEVLSNREARHLA